MQHGSSGILVLISYDRCQLKKKENWSHVLMWNIKARVYIIQWLLARLKVLKSRSNSKVKVKSFGTHEKALSHRIFMWNIKALALTVQKLLARLLSKKLVGLQGQGHRVKKTFVPTARLCHYNNFTFC